MADNNKILWSSRVRSLNNSGVSSVNSKSIADLDVLKSIVVDDSSKYNYRTNRNVFKRITRWL